MDIQKTIKQTSDRTSIDAASFLVGLMKASSVAPTRIPSNFIEQFQLYSNGGDYRLYVYIDNSWKYVTLT